MPTLGPPEQSSHNRSQSLRPDVRGSERGSALISVLIASSIVGALAYMTLFSLNAQNQSASRTRASSEFNDIVYETQTALRHPSSCIKAAASYSGGSATALGNLSSLGYLADGPSGIATTPLGFSPGRTFRTIQNVSFDISTPPSPISHGTFSYLTSLRIRATPLDQSASRIPFSELITVYWAVDASGDLVSCKLARISSDGRPIEERICAIRFSNATQYFTYDPASNSCINKVCPPGQTITDTKTGVCG
jgi:hypothetical protein